MTHAKQHGGWARQASRRGETYRMCLTCGMKSHPRQQATPVEPEEQWGPVKFLTVVVFGIAFLYAVVIIAAAGQVAAA